VKLNEINCPCYVCLVAGMCPGKDPSIEEKQRIEKEVAESTEDTFTYDHSDNSWVTEDLHPIEEAHLDCPEYMKWIGFNPEELELKYVGIEFPQMKLLGEKEIEFHKRQNRKIC